MFKKLMCLVSMGLIIGLAQASVASALDPNLVGWWTFDEGAGDIAVDFGAGDMHGTLVNGPVRRQDGVRGGCLFFDGYDDYVWVKDQDALNPGAGSFTIAFWAYVEVTPGSRGHTNWDLAVTRREAQGNGYYVGADRNQGGADETGYKFMLGDTDSHRIDTPYVTVPLGEWAFVAAVLDRARDEQKISIDGGQTWATTTPPAGPIAPVQDLGIGWDIGENNYWLHGRIDEVALFNRALSNSRVGLIMQEGVVPELAKDAFPANGATDVPTDAVLSWDSGAYAASHDVYFGTNATDVEAASRNDSLGLQVSLDLDTPQYDPGALTLGETYYWRVDEVNSLPDSTIFEGHVWSFTVEPVGYTLAAEHITATASSSNSTDEGPEKTVGNVGLDSNDAHSAELTEMWLSAEVGVDESAWIQYEFDKVYALHEMQIWNHNGPIESLVGLGIKEACVEYSVDGDVWVSLGDVQTFDRALGKESCELETKVDFAGAAARYVRITPVSNWGGVLNQYGLSEVRFLYIPMRAHTLDPAPETVDLQPETTLSWRAGRDATRYDVYLSTDEQAVTDGTAPVTTVSETGFDPGPLELGRTYYWRVDVVNEAVAISVWEGDVCSFSTQEYIVVDDFETYTDYSPNRVFQTWIDGWGFSEDDYFPGGNAGNGTGAQIGYLDPPFAEQVIVHSGSQSMPLVYSNTTLTYSEAERSFDQPQNWTSYGIGTLTVYFRGTLDNTGQPYVKINGTKVPYNGNAADIAKVVWSPAWSIDLSTVGVDLTNVTTLAVGVDGAGAAGSLYVDDIRLYPTPPESIVPVEPDRARLIAHYALDGDVTDGSGNGFDGETNGEPVYVAGVRGQAVEFDGSDQYVRVVHDDRLNPSDGDFSIAFWAQLDPTAGTSGSTNWDMAIGKRETGSKGYYVGADRNQGSDMQAGFKFMLGNTSSKRVDTGYEIVPLGEWVFVTSVLNRAQNVQKISVDGGNTWTTTTPPSGSVVPAQDLAIGFDIGPNNYWFHGRIDEVRLYDTALSDEEVNWLARN